jgi:hypothetical protein
MSMEDQELVENLLRADSLPPRRKLRSQTKVEKKQLQEDLDMEEAAELLSFLPAAVEEEARAAAAAAEAAAERRKAAAAAAAEALKSQAEAAAAAAAAAAAEPVPAHPAECNGVGGTWGREASPEEEEEELVGVLSTFTGATSRHPSALALTNGRAAEAVAEFKAQLVTRCHHWVEAAQQLLADGTSSPVDLDVLLTEAQQYIWGPAECEEARQLHALLQRAKKWAADVRDCSAGRPSLHQVEELLAWEPPPVAAPGLPQLKEVAAAAYAWRSKCYSITGLLPTAGPVPAAAPAAANVPPAAATAAGGGVDAAVAPLPPPPPSAAAAAAGGKTGVIDLRALNSLVAEGGRLLVEVPELKLLQEKQETAKTLSAAVKAAVAATGEERSDVPALRALQQRISACGVNMSDSKPLAALLEQGEQLQARAKECLRTKQPMEDLKQLLKDAALAAVYIADVDAVAGLVEKAEGWLARASAASSKGSMPLKQMRDLLHAGERMGVEMEAVEALRGDIRRREWEENARKAVSTKASLSFITETLEEAERLGLEDTPAAAAVRVVYDKAAAWDAQAQQLLKRAGAAAAALQVKLLAAGVLPPAAADKQRGGRRSSAAGLAALAAAAAAAATPPPDAAPARDGTPAAAGGAASDAAEGSAPPAAGTGSDAATAAGGGEPQPVTLEELGELVTEGQGLGVKLERLYEAQRLHSSCHSWQSQVEEVQEAMAAAKEAAAEDPGSLTSEDLPSAQDLSALLLQGAQTGVALEGLEGLQRVLEEGKGWQAAAAALLEAAGDAGQVAALQQLLLEGQRSGIAFDELAQVEARLAALQWEGEVRALFGEQLGPFLERHKQLKQEREQRAAEEAAQEEQRRAEEEAAEQAAEAEVAAAAEAAAADQDSAEAPVVKQEPSQQQQEEEQQQAAPVDMETEEAQSAQQQQKADAAGADADGKGAAAAAAAAEADDNQQEQQQQAQGSSAAADVEQGGQEAPDATTPAQEDASAASAEPQQEQEPQPEQQEAAAEVKEEAEEEGSEGGGSEEGSAAPVVGKGRAGKRQHGSSTATGIAPAAAAAHHQQQCLEQLPSLEDQAAQQEGKVPLGEVRRLLEAAEKLPVDEDLQEALAAWVEEGEEWEERAGGVLSGEGLEGQPEASVASVVGLIQAGLAQPLR